MAGELERFGAGCLQGALTGVGAGATAGSAVPGLGTGVGALTGAVVGCIGAGAAGAWTGQTRPVLPPIGGTQANLLLQQVSSSQGAVDQSGVRFSPGYTPPTPATAAPAVSPLLLVLGVVLAGVVAWALTRRR